MTDVFSEQLESWRDYVASPWGRIRYAVVEETLRREAARLGTGLRILDVGGGDGQDALPLALAGHDVTILDQSATWLEQARTRAAEAGTSLRTVVGDLSDPPGLGEFDLVLCHFVMQYRPDNGDLEHLARYCRPGGVVSVILPNPPSMVLRRLLLDGPAAALEEMRVDTKTAVTFDHEVRKIPSEALERDMAAAGLPVVRRYGSRIANDLIVSNDAKTDPEFFHQLLDLELALADQEPFLRIGAMYQCVGQKDPGS